jgi:hypothetical protein
VQFMDFVRNIGMFECFGTFRRFFRNCLAANMRRSQYDTEGGLPLNGAVTPAYWVRVIVHGDDQDELRYLNDFVGKNRHIYSEKPPLPPCGDRNSSPNRGESRSEKVVQTEHSNDP